MTGRFPSQRTSNAENVSIWWRHHAALGGIISWSSLTSTWPLVIILWPLRNSLGCCISSRGSELSYCGRHLLSHNHQSISYGRHLLFRGSRLSFHVHRSSLICLLCVHHCTCNICIIGIWLSHSEHNHFDMYIYFNGGCKISNGAPIHSQTRSIIYAMGRKCNKYSVKHVFYDYFFANFVKSSLIWMCSTIQDTKLVAVK